MDSVLTKETQATPGSLQGLSTEQVCSLIGISRVTLSKQAKKVGIRPEVQTVTFTVKKLIWKKDEMLRIVDSLSPNRAAKIISNLKRNEIL